MTSIFFNATPFNLTASAAKEYYHANYGIYYIVTNNYVKITGCDSTDERIVLPSKLQNKKVSYIAKGAFKDNTTMKKIQINSSSMRIEAEAFSGCTALEQVQMRTDNYIAYLGSKAFYNCVNLTSIDINKISTIRSEAFYNCQSLRSEKLGDSVSVGDRAFYNCGELVIDGAGFTEVGDSAFYECSSLSNITFADSIKKIGAEAFYNTLVDNVSFGGDVEIGNKAFYQSSPDTIFFGGKTKIGDQAFYRCIHHQEVSLGENGVITSIGDTAFYRCNSLERIQLREGLTEIKDKAFLNCFELKSVVFPKSLTTLGQSAFEFCEALQSVEFLGRLAEIPHSAFAGNINLTSVKLPFGIKTIRSYAFEDCGIENLILPPTVTRIEDKAFAMCTLMTDITIPQSVQYIANNAFSDCLKLSTVHFGGDSQKWKKLPGTDQKYLSNIKVIYDYKPTFQATVSSDKTTISVSTALFEETGVTGGTFILAMYSGNQMTAIQTKEYDGSEISFTVASPFEAAKVMFWADFKDMFPLCQVDSL